MFIIKYLKLFINFRLTVYGRMQHRSGIAVMHNAKIKLANLRRVTHENRLERTAAIALAAVAA